MIIYLFCFVKSDSKLSPKCRCKYCQPEDSAKRMDNLFGPTIESKVSFHISNMRFFFSKVFNFFSINKNWSSFLLLYSMLLRLETDFSTYANFFLQGRIQKLMVQMIDFLVQLWLIRWKQRWAFSYQACAFSFRKYLIFFLLSTTIDHVFCYCIVWCC